MRFGVRALEFIANYQILEEKIISTRPTGLLVVKRISKKHIDWRELYRLITKINQLIDATMDLIYSIGKLSNKTVDLSTPAISYIKFESPRV